MAYLVRDNEAGFTLIELLISMAISGIILGSMFTFLIAQRKYFSVQEQVTEMTQSARAAMDMMSREIQMAGYNPNPIKAIFDGITLDPSQIHIKADLNGNGAVTTAGNLDEDITYRYFNTSDYHYQIKRKTVDGGTSGFQPFAENIQSFNFDYLDSNGTTATTSANIRQVRITITARTAKPDLNYSTNGGYRTYTLTSLITPRNLAYP